MNESNKKLTWHLVIGALAAVLAVLKNNTADGFTAHDAIDALYALAIYLTGAFQQAPTDAREPDAQTRATDKQ